MRGKYPRQRVDGGVPGIMAEYIKRDTAIRAVMAAKWVDGSDGAIAMEIVASPPAADVVPVVHGRWLHSGCEEYSGLEVVKCSECNHEAFAIAFYVCNGNYCPSCGARMDGGVDNGRNDT